MAQPISELPEGMLPQWAALTADEQSAYELMHTLQTARVVLGVASLVRDGIEGAPVPDLEPLRQKVAGLALTAVEELARTVESLGRQLDIAPYGAPAQENATLLSFVPPPRSVPAEVLSPEAIAVDSVEPADPQAALLPEASSPQVSGGIEASAETHEDTVAVPDEAAEEAARTPINRRQQAFISSVYDGSELEPSIAKLSNQEADELIVVLAEMYVRKNQKITSARRQVQRLVLFLEGKSREEIIIAEGRPVKPEALTKGRLIMVQILSRYSVDQLEAPLKRIIGRREGPLPEEASVAVSEVATAEPEEISATDQSAEAAAAPAQHAEAEPETPEVILKSLVREFGDAVGLTKLQVSEFMKRFDRRDIHATSPEAVEAINEFWSAYDKARLVHGQLFTPVEHSAVELLRGKSPTINKPVPGKFIENMLRAKMPINQTITDVFNSIFTKVNEALKQKK